LEKTDAFGLSGNPDMTIFIVATSNDLVNEQVYFTLGDFSVSGGFMKFFQNNNSLSSKIGIRFGNGELRYTFTPGIMTKHLFTIQKPGASIHSSTRVWVDGVEIFLEASSSNNLNLVDNAFILGGDTLAAIGEFDGSFGNLAVYNTILSDADRVETENYIKVFEGI